MSPEYFPKKSSSIKKKPVTLSQTTCGILYSSKLKEFADDDFKFDKKSIKFSKRIANAVGRGEIVHYEQFLLFPQCFQNISNVDS